MLAAVVAGDRDRRLAQRCSRGWCWWRHGTSQHWERSLHEQGYRSVMQEQAVQLSGFLPGQSSPPVPPGFLPAQGSFPGGSRDRLLVGTSGRAARLQPLGGCFRPAAPTAQPQKLHGATLESDSEAWGVSAPAWEVCVALSAWIQPTNTFWQTIGLHSLAHGKHILKIRFAGSWAAR